MATRVRKYPALQQFLDLARQSGYTDDQIEQQDQTIYARRYNGTNRTAVRVRLRGPRGGPTAYFTKDTGAFIKAESGRGYSMSKTEVWADAVNWTAKAIAEQEKAEKQAAADKNTEHISKVAEAYDQAMELERLTFGRAFKLAGDAGITKAEAIEVVLALHDSGVMDEIKRVVSARVRVGDGQLPGSNYKPSGVEFENGRPKGGN